MIADIAEESVDAGKGIDVQSLMSDPYAPEFAHLRQTLLAHLRVKAQEMADARETESMVDSVGDKKDARSRQDLPDGTSVYQDHGSIEALAGGHSASCHDSESDGVREDRQRGWDYGKLARVLDVVAGTALLVVSWPVGLLVGMAIWCETPGPILSRVLRLGCGERPLMLYRFRTTQTNPSAETAYSTHVDDFPVTRMGVLLRNTKLQRLPEIVNVLKGDMSLVGPRARHPWFAQYMTPQQRRYIFSVRPGLVGPTQLRFRYERRLLACQRDKLGYLTRILLPLQFSIEEDYVRQRCLRQDLKLIARAWRVTWRNFGSRNRQVVRDWLEQGGQTGALVGPHPPSDAAVQEFYPQSAACMYTRRWECFAFKNNRG